MRKESLVVMNLSQQINEYFSNLIEGNSKRLEKYNAWVFIKENGDYGVAIKYEGEKVNESFANIKMYSAFLTLDDSDQQYLILSSSLKQSINEFSIVCAHFIDFDEEYSNKEKIIKDPYKWWDQWKELIGNAVRNPRPYPIIGEMLTYLFLLRKGYNIEWMPSNYRTHDLSSESFEVEVKSSLSKYDDSVTINSQFQLDDLNYLYMLKFERNNKGVSINDVTEEIVKVKNNRDFLEKELMILGYPEGNSTRKEKYKLLEMKEYNIDENFPGYNLNAFLKNFDDPYVSKITYEINLIGLPYKKIEL
jgi:hypothetical protein